MPSEYFEVQGRYGIRDTEGRYGTPSHLVNSRSLLGSAFEIPESSLQSFQRRQQFLKTLVYLFWAVWSNEYLIELRLFFNSPSNNLSNPPPKENNIVLLHEKRPRHCWRIGKLSKLLIGRDGQIRAAGVISTGKILGDHCN